MCAHAHTQVPWGVANGLLAGGGRDIILFWGIALYAVCGCYAQDVRARESSAVGTVFGRGDLDEFYSATSFLPGLALADGRQDWATAVSELPPLAFLLGALVAGSLVEHALADFLLSS